MTKLICQVCKQDHSKPLEKWCDRSDLEIKYDALKSDLARKDEALRVAREALSIYSEPYFYELQDQGYRNCLDDLGKYAREALKQQE